MTALMALFADHVMGLVASTRRNYLAEFNDYLDGRGVKPRPRHGQCTPNAPTV